MTEGGTGMTEEWARGAFFNEGDGVVGDWLIIGIDRGWVEVKNHMVVIYFQSGGVG